jgi:hypothetical protein
MQMWLFQFIIQFNEGGVSGKVVSNLAEVVVPKLRDQLPQPFSAAALLQYA